MTTLLNFLQKLSGTETKSLQLNYKGDSKNDMTDGDLEDELQQPPSNEMVTNVLCIWRLYLKRNKNTTDSFYNSLNNTEEFFEKQNKKLSRQSQRTDYFKKSK